MKDCSRPFSEDSGELAIQSHRIDPKIGVATATRVQKHIERFVRLSPRFHLQRVILEFPTFRLVPTDHIGSVGPTEPEQILSD